MTEEYRSYQISLLIQVIISGYLINLTENLPSR
jgi:hypothetical protein